MKYLIVLVLFIFSLVACKKQTETLAITDVSSYYPMSVGRVFIYRMDSARLINFTNFDTAHYLVKDSVAGSFVDLTGRKSYTVFRYITDTLAAQPYQYSETHYIVFDKNRIEYVDGANYRFTPLVNPLSFNTSWYGNLYLDSAQLHITTNTSYLGWLYQYANINQPYTVLDSTYQNTVTVQQIDASSNLSDPSALYTRHYSTEVYANQVGLVYKQIIVYSHQPQTPDNSKPAYFEDGCFGVKLRLVSYK